MSKEYTNYLKGVAILMMLFLHLFQHIEWDMSLSSIFHIKDIPLVFYIARMCNPVPFFLILSGYGLYAVYTKSGGVKPWKRVSNLYIHLLLIYLLLVPLASYVKPEMYPGSMSVFLKNVTSWQCTYIGEQWFFLPYIILMIVSKWVFKFFDKLRCYWLIGVVVVIWMGTTYILKHFDSDTLASNMLFYNIFLAVFMLPSFTLGYMANRFAWVNKMNVLFTKYGKGINTLPAIFLIALCIFRCFVPNASIAPYFAITFILLFAQISLGKYTGNVLTYLGKHSMNMWLIHTWFSTRLFHGFFFDHLQYPVLIYITLLTISLAASNLIEIMYKPLSSFVSRIKC